jgi:hypothetical protein
VRHRRPREAPRLAAVSAIAVAATTTLVSAVGCGAERPDAERQPAITAPATTTAPTATSRAATLRAAEALVGLDPRRLGVRVALRGRRPGLAAQLDRTARTVTLFASGSEAPHRLAHDLAHELGHAVDLDRLSAADRRAYLVRRGRPRSAWWPAADVASDYGTGAGDFAEVFALCHAASPVFRSRLAPRPADACALLPRAASSFATVPPKDG